MNKEEFERSLIESRVDIIVRRLVLQVEDDLNHYINDELLDVMDITSDPKMHDLWNDMYLEIHDRLIIELNHRR